jgi:hypothetical protein
MAHGKVGTFINIGGQPVDLNSGLVDALVHPSPGYESKRTFAASDMMTRVAAIDWFSRCGRSLEVELSCPFDLVSNWDDAIHACSSADWDNAQLEAQNQLTVWLTLHAANAYRDWNRIAAVLKTEVIEPLVVQPLVKLRAAEGIRANVRWDILAALMENSFIDTGHRSFFFLELFEIYEAGHFPCGWIGEWPRGTLLVL